MRRTRKLSRFETTTAVDRISEFPDSILVHILSLLRIEYAVRTQVLSKRWRFLWTFLPSLLFCYSAFDDDRGEGEDFRVARNTDFVNFVGKTLFASNCKLKKFEVDICYHPRLLRMSIRGLDSPRERALRSLTFNSVLTPPTRKLSIGDVELSNDVIERILAGSPVLETLELHSCEGFSRLAVTNSCVKKLILRNCLDIWDLSDDKWCEVEDRANGYERIQNIVVVFLASLLHVKNLTLGTWAIQSYPLFVLLNLFQVLSFMEAKGLSCPLLNCKCLTLDTDINKYVLPGIANVFKSTPNVEALIMTWSVSSSELYGIRSTMLLNYNEEQYWTSQKWTYKCLTLHLKNVTISNCLT
ncbi:hypothetical protein C3L33_06298, partial [Rhododendron williamsianum]